MARRGPHGSNGGSRGSPEAGVGHTYALRRMLLGVLAGAALVVIFVQFRPPGEKATSLLSDPRLLARGPAGTVELPPPGKCPTAILRHPARTRRIKETFEQCLARHGKDITKRIVTKWLRAAEASTGRERVEYLARHVVDMWMWTLRQRHNTPCVPLIITFRCNNEGTGDIPHCSGVGDRIKGVEVAFWLAVFTNSVFVLDWNRPAPLTEFFVPAMPELHFPEFRDCIGNSRLEPTHWVPHMRPLRPTGDDNVTAHLHSLDRITELRPTLNWHLYDWVQVKCNHGLLAYVLRAKSLAAARERYSLQRNPLRDFLYITNRLWLGTPTERLQHMTEPFVKRFQRVRGTLGIGVHLRMGDSGLPNAKKRNDRRIPLEAVVCWVDRVRQECDAGWPRKCVVFLASDSGVAARVFMDELARHKIEVVSAPGEAIHIDWVNTTAATPEDLVQQASKTYLDWHMLTQMDTLVMSSGSFAFTAAYSFVGDTAVYMPSGEEGECRFRDFQHECVKEACPGQVDFYSERLLGEAWNSGAYPASTSS